MLAITSFEATNSVYNITDENNSFSIITPGHWSSQNSEEIVDERNNLLDLRSKNDLDLHIKEVNKRGNIIILDGQEYIYYNLNKYDFIELLKKNKYKDLEDMVFRFELTYNEIVDILDIKYIPTSTKGYTLPCGIYEIRDINFMIQSLLPNDVEVKISIDGVRFRSNLTTNRTIKFTKRSFFYTILGFTQSHQGSLDDIDGFYQIIAGNYKSNKPISIIGIDKIHLKADCVDGSIVNGVREPILFSFSLDKPPGHKIYKEPKVKLFKKINKPILSHITFYLEDDDHKAVNFNGETVSFTCQLIKI